jgi:hypothetical protein
MAGGGRYGKKPLWFWLLVYAAVGGAAYLLIYFLFLADGAGGGVPGY